MTANNTIAAGESLHLLKAQLDRLPDNPLVLEISTLLGDYPNAEQWRTQEFEVKFDSLTHRVAELAHPSTLF